jgi:hypothetical protein
MNSKDALNIFGLKSNATFDLIKAAYRRACSEYHPDRNPAGLEMMKIVNAAYSALSDYVPSSIEEDFSDELNLGEDLNKALNAIINLGLTIEICGSWVWVSGDTKPYKEILKEAGFRWAPKKMMWHFRPADYKSFNRGKWSIDQIREKHGSINIKTNLSMRIEGRAA